VLARVSVLISLFKTEKIYFIHFKTSQTSQELTSRLLIAGIVRASKNFEPDWNDPGGASKDVSSWGAAFLLIIFSFAGTLMFSVGVNIPN